MALNDVKKTVQSELKKGLGEYNLSSDDLKWVIITEDFPSIDANAANVGIAQYTKVASAGNYVQDESLTNVTWTASANVINLDFDNLSFAADGANPTTGKTLAVYNNTSTNKDVLFFVDMTADGGTTAADTTLGFNYTVNPADGAVKVTVNPA